jgi:hypothetical protein
MGSKIIYLGSTKFIFLGSRFHKLGSRFYFFGQQFYFFRTAKFINGQQLLKH